MLAGIPGLVFLARFVPPRIKEPTFEIEPPRVGPRLSTAALTARGVAGGLAGLVFALLLLATLASLQAVSDGTGFQITAELRAILVPADVRDVLRLVGAGVFGLVCGLLTAAVGAARTVESSLL
jgi:PAT family beta-lactamase induction signal transducer AmpG